MEQYISLSAQVMLKDEVGWHVRKRDRLLAYERNLTKAILLKSLVFVL